MIIPSSHNITVRRGDTFSETFYFYTDAAKTVSMDLSGYTIESQIRKGQTTSDTLIATFTVDTSGLASGWFTISLSYSTTEEISSSYSKGFYDIKLTNADGEKYTYIEGNVTFENTVTS